jgi:uridine kinase
MANRVFVIALVGTSGAGKSTLMRELVKVLGDATSLSFDDYIESSTYPPAIQWLADGADPNQWLTPDYVRDVQKLRNGESIINPMTKEEVKPAQFLVLEEHFGRERDLMRDLIDMLVLIDIPLEIAHARKILRKGDFLPWEDNPDLFLKNLRDHLNWYIRVGRDFYLAVHKMVRTNCDLIVDGSLPTEKMAEDVCRFIKESLSDEPK